MPTSAGSSATNCATRSSSNSNSRRDAASPDRAHAGEGHSISSSSPIAITSGAVHIPTTTAPAVEVLSTDSGKPIEAKGTEFSQMESPPDWPPSEPPAAVEVGNVSAWSSDFDVLLADPLGVKAFEVRHILSY